MNNDERIMIRYKRHMFPAIIEMQKTLSDHSVECVDLLDPELKSCVVFDRTSARKIPRFTQLLCWICHYPHFSRPGPAAQEIPESVRADFITAIERLAGKGRFRRRKVDIREFLKDNYTDCIHLLWEMSRQNTIDAIRRSDFHLCRALYEIEGDRDKVMAILDAKPDFQLREGVQDEGDDLETISYDWLRRGESKTLEKQMPAAFRHAGEEEGFGMPGLVKITGNAFVYETMTRMKFSFGCKMLDKYFGDLLALRGETKEDLGEKLERELAKDFERPGKKLKKKDDSEIPWEIQKSLIEEFYKNTYRKFIDEQIPMLNGLTPREAAREPSMRPKLVELVKFHLHGLDKQRKEEGIEVNIDVILRELGLEELIID